MKVTRGVDHFDEIRERTFQRLAYWKYSLKLSCLGGNTRPGSVVHLTLLLHYNFINVYLKITQTRFPLEFNIKLKALVSENFTSRKVFSCWAGAFCRPWPTDAGLSAQMENRWNISFTINENPSPCSPSTHAAEGSLHPAHPCRREVSRWVSASEAAGSLWAPGRCGCLPLRKQPGGKGGKTIHWAQLPKSPPWRDHLAKSVCHECSRKQLEGILTTDNSDVF